MDRRVELLLTFTSHSTSQHGEKLFDSGLMSYANYRQMERKQTDDLIMRASWAGLDKFRVRRLRRIMTESSLVSSGLSQVSEPARKFNSLRFRTSSRYDFAFAALQNRELSTPYYQGKGRLQRSCP